MLLAQRDYRAAANQFLENYTADPNGARAPDSLLKLGTALNGLGEREAACSSLEEFFELEVFNFPSGAAGTQLRKDVSAFMLCFDTGTHPAVGAQVVRGGASPDSLSRLETLRIVAESGAGDLVAHGTFDGVRRGFLLGENLVVLSDSAGETYDFTDLEAATSTDAPFIYTLVPPGSGVRIALDRDLDGTFDRDEIRRRLLMRLFGHPVTLLPAAAGLVSLSLPLVTALLTLPLLFLCLLMGSTEYAPPGK